MDLTSHIFAPGQLYVALSRVKALEGLYLTKPVTYSDIIADESIFDFLYRLRLKNLPDRDPEKQEVTFSNEIFEYRTELVKEFVTRNEPDEMVRSNMLHILKGYCELCKIEAYTLARDELIKFIDLVESIYDTSMLEDMRMMLMEMILDKHSYSSVLDLLLERYEKAVNNSQRRKFISESRVLPKTSF